MGPQLGSGAFAEVRKCKHKATGNINAVKLIRKQSMNKEQEEMF